ncbi:cupredoxin domain-containing protein [Candidatus Woesearchaeota archaeon]|nr:cupredoxin domain-containing protein [Candidatus Woesearchaeota archaeon]
MEQKQLDEIDESYFGEEFIEEETPEEHMVLKAKHERKALAAKRLAEKAAKEAKETAKKAVKDAKKIEPLKVETYHDEPITIKPAKEEPKPVISVKDPVETAKPVNPWASEEPDTGFFQETSTWKALTGIVLILLILSILTQGFRFSAESLTSASTASTLTISEAQVKAVAYVNTKLLQPPFTAEVKSSEEINNLYHFKLSVAGQEVDSYITKDGKLFFPQGLDLSKETTAKSTETKPAEKTTTETTKPSAEKSTAPSTTKPVETTKSETKTEPKPAAVVEAKKPNTRQVTIIAKKWIFSPDKIIIKKGEPIMFTIKPEDLDFEFAVADLGITKKVPGLTTNIEFTPQKSGTFTFLCNNCEDWRGMKGTLIVE